MPQIENIMIEQIKQARAQMLTEEQKSFIKKFLKHELTRKEFAVIEGARHFSNHGGDEWRMRDEPQRNFMCCRAPYKCHPAISDWLQSLGFHTARYINRGGVEYGMKVWI